MQIGLFSVWEGLFGGEVLEWIGSYCAAGGIG
ncbi:MAG: hypothetical protein H6Q66_24 [Firmicutes bacterium]|nr:hypothetical protein [Bacillota bacterium]